MKRLICCLGLVITFSSAFSQKVYFIYLQTENEQPFYVKVNDKTYSSSASGYVILSKLPDTTYELNIGFPQNKWPEQGFSVYINAKDHGFLLKNFEDKSWGLFDLQTLAVQMAVTAAEKDNVVKTEPKQVSIFTDILSKAANDPSLKEKPVTVPPVISKEEPDVVKEKPFVISPVVTNDPPSKKEESKLIQLPEYKKSVVIKKSESSTIEGLGLIFIDEYADGKKDTINIIIPNPKVSVTETQEKPKEEKKFLDIESKPVTKETVTAKPVNKNDCSSVASESDFLKLRKKMAGETTDDGMINEVQKVFRSKCFTVSQIKNLGTLFLNDGGKYKFFDAAYSHVYDIENFESLQSGLTDEYYINRFKAILK